MKTWLSPWWALLALFCHLPASSHEFWMVPSSFAVDFGGGGRKKRLSCRT